MEKNSNTPSEEKTKDTVEQKGKRTDIFKEEGSSRAIVSGAYFFVFAIVGSVLLLVFAVMATDNPGFAYYGEAFVILNMFTAVGSGIYPMYVSRVKAKFVHDKERALYLASSYSKIILLIGVILTSLAVLLYFIVPSDLVKAATLAAIPAILLGYVGGSFSQMVSLVNRFDIAAFISSLFGIVVFICGLLFISLGFAPIWFAYIPLIIGLCSTPLALFFFFRVSPFKFKDLYTKGELFGKENAIFLKEGLYSTLTNLEGLGILGNTVFFITTLSLYAFYPNLEYLGVQLITLIMI